MYLNKSPTPIIWDCLLIEVQHFMYLNTVLQESGGATVYIEVQHFMYLNIFGRMMPNM